MVRNKLRISLRAKFLFVIIAGIVTVTILTGYLSYSRAKTALEDELGHTLMSIADTTVLMINGDDHNLLKTPADEKTVPYNKIKKILQQVRDINKAAYVYTLAPKNDEKVVFVVDAAIGDDMSHIGDEYDYEPEMKTAFTGQSTFTKEVYTDAWGTFKTGYAPIKDSKGKVVAILGVDLSAERMIAAEKELRNRYFVAGGIGVLLGILLAVVFTGYLVLPIRRMVGTMSDIADMNGDLTKEIKVGSSDEIGELAKQFNRMLSNLRNVMKQVRESTKQVALTSAELSDTSSKARQATSSIVEAIDSTVEAVEVGSENQRQGVEQARAVMGQFNNSLQQVASGAMEQAAQISKSSLYVNEIADEIRQMAESSQTVAESSEQTTEAAVKGRDVITDTVSRMKNIRKIVTEAAGNIQELGSMSEQIGKIIMVIDDLAQQTNLLALNAAIEAARAGAHGKGFAVVADEVRNLAERSSKSTREIGDLIGVITSGIERSVTSMSTVTSEVDQGFSQAEEAGQTLHEILSLANTANHQIKQINESTGKIFDKSRNMVETIDSVAAIVEENSAATTEMADGSKNVQSMVEKIGYISSESARAVKEVSASGEEMRHVLDTVTSSSELLAAMAHQLEAVTAQFKIE